MERNRKLSIIADPSTLLLGMLTTTIGIGFSLGFILYFTITGEHRDVIGSLCILGPIMVLYIVATVFALPRWYTRITLLPESVIIKTALRSPIERSYKYYQYVYRAWYWHGSPIGVGMNVDYIVISHRRMRDEELTNINQPRRAPTSLRSIIPPKHTGS